MAQVTTSLVVNFGSASGGSAAANAVMLVEVDPNAPTTHIPGDSVPLQLFTTTNVTVNKTDVSAGVLAVTGSGTRTITEDITFSNTNSASLSHPALNPSAVSFNWYGKSLGTATITDETLITTEQTGVAVAQVTYETAYTEYTLTAPSTAGGLTTFPISVYFEGTTP